MAHSSFSSLLVSRLRFAFSLMLLVGFTCHVTQAQLAGNGAITGTVTDSTGAVVPNATITVAAVATNQTTVRNTHQRRRLQRNSAAAGNLHHHRDGARIREISCRRM